MLLPEFYVLKFLLVESNIVNIKFNIKRYRR